VWPPCALSQTWSRYFYEQTTIYGIIDGICYFNANNDETALEESSVKIMPFGLKI
jgi:hypothetical protein